MLTHNTNRPASKPAGRPTGRLRNFLSMIILLILGIVGLQASPVRQPVLRLWEDLVACFRASRIGTADLAVSTADLAVSTALVTNDQQRRGRTAARGHVQER